MEYQVDKNEHFQHLLLFKVLKLSKLYTFLAPFFIAGGYAINKIMFLAMFSHD